MIIASRLLHLFAAFAVLLPAAAMAQQAELEERQNTEAPFLLGSQVYSIGFVHKPDAAPNEATLRISQPLSVSGCAQIQPMSTHTKVFGQRLEFIISEPVVKLDKDPQYSQFACRQAVNTVMTDVVFNRALILENGINRVVLKGPFGQDQYDVYADDHKLSLFTKTRDALTGKHMKLSDGTGKNFFKPVKSTQRKEPLTYWFYPDNTVLLYISGTTADPGQVAQQASLLAGQHGMIEARFAMPGFVSPLADKNVFYYVDQTGLLADRLRQKNPAQFGNITVKEVLHGAEGPYEKDKVVAVYARLPGLMD